MRYDDLTVTEMGSLDGEAAMGAARWGPNKILYGLLAVLHTTIAHTSAIRVRLDGRLVQVRTRYERLKAAFESTSQNAGSALTTVGREDSERRDVVQRIADHGLLRPASRRPAICFLALIVLGDLALTSIAMAVLGVSDHRFVSFLPVSELQVAAAPVVSGMVAAAHVLGEAVREHRDPDQRVRTHVKIVIGVAVGGGLMLALGVAAVRGAYLTANGVEAMTIAFVALQAGLFAVAVAISVHGAHPYGTALRQQERRLSRAVSRYQRLRRRAGRCAAAVNGVVTAHHGAVTSARAGVEAVCGDTIRAGFLYRRAVMHGHSEPAGEPLFEGQVPDVDVPCSVQELLKYPDVADDSILSAPAPVSCETLDRRWAALQVGTASSRTQPLHLVHEDDYLGEVDA
ncbi:hypothetical protein [Streptomyces sp. NPDC058307]|uniref:hypothetical protein n=1 Tax=Streptomyces sp. NPDC058307 TaxID=3346439 RepID=UPI0036E1D0E9